ncbi:MAG: DNA polymerase III, partial [Nitrososphaera sp.]
MAKNADISKALRELGFLTEVEGGENVQFKARAYYKAADTIANLTKDISELYSQGGVSMLLQIPSIGKAIASKIEQFIKDGRMDQLE